MADRSDEATPLINNSPPRISHGKLYLAVFSAVLGNFNFGFALVFPSPVIPQLKQGDDTRLQMNVHQISWFGSIFTLGAAAGGLSAMFLNDRVGRKISIMISGLPSVLGLLVMGSAQNFWMLLWGRFLTGIAGGITAGSIPVYVSEISHPSVRGALGSCPQITAVFGSLALYAFGLILPWRWLAVAGEVPVVIMMLLLCCMPTSPRYHIMKGNRAKAVKSLEWLRGPNSDYMTEFNKIERSITTQGVQWSDLKTKSYYKPILISVVMRFLQQMTGITPILVYLEPIFHLTAISLEPKYDAALVGAVRLISVAIAASLMDKAGRKALLFTSGFLIYIAMLSMTMYTHQTPCSQGNLTLTDGLNISSEVQAGAAFDPKTLIPLISAMVIIFGYAMGWGPITWLLMSEILPLGARGVASGLCVGVSWITAFVLTQLFMHVVVAYGLYVPFLFFCVVSVVNIIFTAKCVPETKGRTLEEIENYFRTGRSFTIHDP
ncbi:solute carrier family 2, facilitated glucose transporter member 6 [Danio rerio]|uniref:Solute carrier family 2, facilitated glucose transporter member 6 n=1 Tax=Danio rerio TaxID=7955 RepID=F1RB41_DANRE|nr:solute carrier family 2, facilitated glucose transporter member 6 [Danio rerio]|eukprot:XP_689092.6 solute carrier family 2, facilitated glucose transporter member 6 [Danio rerio]